MFENSYLSLSKKFYSRQKPKACREPKLFCFNTPLAKELGVDIDDENELALIFSGNKVVENSEPISLAYAGHQFGYFTMLGDGRAVLLGELKDSDKKRNDIQLKASGTTPYSRNGDGRGTLSAMLREYLISESMHALGVKTTRSLAVVTTGQRVHREMVHPEAVLTRVASSHIRVGTFEYAKNFLDTDSLKALLEYTIDREYPHLRKSKTVALDFLYEVMKGQIELVVEWMRVGFIHGVMNTDNVSISCETIDYGPCAFMNAFDPLTVYSSIDRWGRYAFGAQPSITKWNLSVLGTALLPLIDRDEEIAIKKVGEMIEGFDRAFRDRYMDMMFKKTALLDNTQNSELIGELLSLMQKNRLDYTNTFALLSMPKDDALNLMDDELKKWYEIWLEKREHSDMSTKAMQRSNPTLIPRNHLVEDALESAENGDRDKFDKLFLKLQNPYDYTKGVNILEQTPRGFDEGFKTFCGT